MVTVTAMMLLLGQCRKPRAWPGRLFIWIMNVRHAGVTQWGLRHVRLQPQFTCLDVGCGGGRTIQHLAAVAAAGTVCGVDYSAASVAAAKRMNAAAIATGHVNVQQASVSTLPFPDGRFDLVSAVETHYYWPAPVSDLREVLRVLKPGGSVVVIAETYRGEALGFLLELPMRLLRARYLSIEEHRALLAAAGFVEVAVHVEARKGWICAIGRKPEALAA